jgi:hypothetical protein
MLVICAPLAASAIYALFCMTNSTSFPKQQRARLVPLATAYAAWPLL